MKLEKLKNKLKNLNSKELMELNNFIQKIFFREIRKQLDKTKGRWDDKNES